MGWETRRGKRYYYRKGRGAGGRLRSIYCGGGERGLAAEREDLARSTTAAGELAQVNAKKKGGRDSRS